MEATLKMIQVALMQTQAKIYELKESQLGIVSGLELSVISSIEISITFAIIPYSFSDIIFPQF